MHRKHHWNYINNLKYNNNNNNNLKMVSTKNRATSSLSSSTLMLTNWHSLKMFSILTFIITINLVESLHDVTQISPKSSSHMPDLNSSPLLTTTELKLEVTKDFFDINTMPKSSIPAESSALSNENETTSSSHIRVERSALPILNENFPKLGPNNVHFPGSSEKELNGIAAAGRYFQYNIKPTNTLKSAEDTEDAMDTDWQTTQKAREGKSVKSQTTSSEPDSFLVNGDHRQQQVSSGSQTLKPTLSTLISQSSNIVSSPLATATPLTAHNSRQNSNPDIQDIITGIVKLLNGNVNVHANTQGVQRRPTASRINNRGPPRISEVQTLPMEYDGQKPGTSSIRPPPYPFDRPERPFITGVPIPEQIVPLRPGFVSNRPPWHRNKPRPPITTSSIGGRRPIPQYKPLPSTQMKPPQEQEQQQQAEGASASQVNKNHAANNEDRLEGPAPTDTTYDADFSSEDINTQYIEVGDNDEEPLAAAGQPIKEVVEDLKPQAFPPAQQPSKKEEHTTNKKKSNKHKSSADKKKHASSHASSLPAAESSSSKLHTEMHMSSAYMPMAMDTIEPSDMNSPVEEVIFMTASKTPELEMFADSAASNSLKIKTSSAMGTTTLKNAASTTISTKPLSTDEQKELFVMPSIDLENTIIPTPIIPQSMQTSNILTNFDSSTTTTPASTTPDSSSTSSTSSSTSTSSTTNTTTTTTTTTSTTESVPISNNNNQNPTPPPSVAQSPTQPSPAYHPRPGIVLDDPEFKPGGRPRPAQQRPPPSQPQVLPPPRNNAGPSFNIQPTRQQLPPGYGEIFDVTLSAIQGPGSKGGSQHTINIKPFGYGATGTGSGAGADIIVSASGEDGFVSIDGKRTYINLFGDPTDSPTGVQINTTPATAIPQLPGGNVVSTQTSPNPLSSSSSSSSSSNGGSGGVVAGSNPVTQQNPINAGTGYGIAETEIVDIHTNKPQSVKPQLPSSAGQPTTANAVATRPHYRPRTTQPPVRIDTCIVGDDSTCDQAQHEYCKTENGVSSCHCRPGYSRRKHREPCRRVIAFFISMRVDRIYEHRIVWDKKLADRSSDPYTQLSYESIKAIDSAMSMTPYSDEFLDAKVNNIYRGDPNLGGSGVFINMTIKLDESVETLRPNLKADVQKHLLGVLHRRNNNIGNSVLYVSSPEGAISALRDLDECQMPDLNDCHPLAECYNTWGSFRCSCPEGTKDLWQDQPTRAGRECQQCPESYCNNRGICSYHEDGSQVCLCDSSHYGGQCEIDGEVLGVAIGASVAAVIIIVLTLVCLIMWSRRWQREQKNAIGSPVFGYMNTAPIKTAPLPQASYQVTLEDRMRWAQIADVMAQSNHYGAEPIGGPTRPSSAMFGYPNLQTLGMGTIGGMSMQSTMHQLHQSNMAPPVPLPRYDLGISTRSKGMRTLENSSSSEEEDRTDLLGRNFQVPRPKSRSNASITNQSGIYYDVDYEPSANGVGNTSVDRLYGSQNHSSHTSHMGGGGGGNSHIPGPQGIPMSTYTSGRAPSSYYMK